MADESDPAARTYESRKLRSKLRFTTHSDARLAGLFLDNDFPIVLFTKVFDVIRDPGFRQEEVTFEDVWDMFVYISARRRKDAARRECPVISTETDAASSGVVPPLVLELVVDRLLEDRTPIGVAAMDPLWTNAFESNMETFHAMSLVHRSWTHIARRGLRHRVVVPYQHINKFLLSPFCGPWINEMIVYWSVENGHIGVTQGDIWLLEALLERTPNLRSLAFNTSLTWPKTCLQPAFDVNICLEVISDLLSNLENLWLKHIQLPISENELCINVCDDLRTLCRQLPKLRSLKFLSLRSWSSRLDAGSISPDQPPLDWNDHPPSQLKTIELDLSENLHTNDLIWLVKPRQDFRLQSLSITARNHRLLRRDHLALREALQIIMPEIKKLHLCIIGSPNRPERDNTEGELRPFYDGLLRSGDKLAELDISIIDDIHFSLSSLCFPPSLERLVIHFHDQDLWQHLVPSSTASSDFIQDIMETISTLTRLQSIVMTGSPKLSAHAIGVWDLDGFTRHVNEDAEPYQDDVSGALSGICTKRNIQLIIMKSVFPQRWDIPRGERRFLFSECIGPMFCLIQIVRVLLQDT